MFLTWPDLCSVRFAQDGKMNEIAHGCAAIPILLCSFARMQCFVCYFAAFSGFSSNETFGLGGPLPPGMCHLLPWKVPPPLTYHPIPPARCGVWRWLAAGSTLAFGAKSLVTAFVFSSRIAPCCGGFWKGISGFVFESKLIQVNGFCSHASSAQEQSFKFPCATLYVSCWFFP